MFYRFLGSGSLDSHRNIRYPHEEAGQVPVAFVKGIQTLDYDIVTYDYDQSDAKIHTEKGDVNGMILDLDSHLEAEEVPESQDASSSHEEFESLTNIPHQSSTKNVPILEPKLPRKQLPERLTREMLSGMPRSVTPQFIWRNTSTPSVFETEIPVSFVYCPFYIL
ncbi:hypothetical protein ACH5RR_035494 [Cinchona calisaya]|uniref:Uncharacterized protein n=1 Tax=Cinchona calisaya TaxID=153742 RepID=A0ABD2Y4D2_9GENT